MPDQNTVADNKNLEKIDHIIVVMMENRSFDHMLGYRRLTGADPSVDGLSGHEVNIGHPQPGIPLVQVRPQRAADLLSGGLAGRIPHDPGHEPKDIRKQLAVDAAYLPNEAERWPMDGFVKSYEDTNPAADPRLVMAYYDEQDVPVHDWLANHFAICDRWFCSVPSWTMPNTFYMLRGQIDAYTKDDGTFAGAGSFYTRSGKGSLLNVLDESTPVRCPTVTAKGKSLRWRCYHSELSHVGLVHHGLVAAALPNDPHFVRMGDSHKRLLNDLRTGNLPGLTFVEPNWVVIPPGNARANDDHAPANIHLGQVFLNEILTAVRASPAWMKTLVLVWYDEHGGFFDHVSPEPTYEDPPLDWTGVRIPALVMSPWVPRRHVVKAQLEHTAIFRTVFQRFAPTALDDPRVAELRLAEARHLGCALTLAEPDLRLDIPNPAVPPSWVQEDSFHGAQPADLPDTLAWFAGYKPHPKGA